MNNFDILRQESQLKRRWAQDNRMSLLALDEKSLNHSFSSSSSQFHKKPPLFSSNKTLNPTLSCPFEDNLVSSVIPPVTVVLEGRSICHRISLHKHESYRSLAKALRKMFVDVDDDNSGDNFGNNSDGDHVLDLSNAIPGHIIAYEDMENDLLLVGDLNWKDFVRVAKRIRIMPVKDKSRKQKESLSRFL